MSRTLIAAAALLVTVGAVVSARQMPPDPVFTGSKMTRQQVLDKLTSDTPGTKADVAKGKELYDTLCASCHIFGDTGTSVGPDLTTLSSRFRKRDTLESIMWPSKTISDQYAVTAFELNDGRLVSGVIVRDDAQRVFIKNAENLERPVVIPLALIKTRTDSTVSLMPENLVMELSLDDIESLVAYAQSGR